LIQSTNDLGRVKIGHNLQGGQDTYSGNVETALGSIKSVTIGGSLIGGTGNGTGCIFVLGTGVGAIKIGGDVQSVERTPGGLFLLQTGSIYAVRGVLDDSAAVNIASITIGGSVIGGSNNTFSQVCADGTIGPVKIGHDVDAGVISSNGKLTSVTIGGSLIGGGMHTGEIFSKGDLGPVKIGGDFRGGSIPSDNFVDSAGLIESKARIVSVTIGGSIIAGIDDGQNGSLTNNAAIRAGADLGSLTVKGSITGSVGRLGHVTSVIISASGQATPTGTTDLAIGKISIGGRLEHAQILAGYKRGTPPGFSTPTNPNAQIGPVSVGGDWIASDLIAGVQDGGAAGFGDAGDTIIGGGASIAKIASIVIKGIVQGTAAGADQFGIESHAIGSLKINGATVPIVSPLALSPLTASDVTVRLV
jgi:hypothetical protein